VANSDEPFARSASDMAPERFCGEEAVRRRPGFSYDHRQKRIVLECHPDEVVRDRGGKQPPSGLPERIDICRPVEAEQRPLDYGIDDWFALHIQPPWAQMRSSWRDRHHVYPPSGRVFSPGPGKAGDQKYNLSYLAIGSLALKFK